MIRLRSRLGLGLDSQATTRQANAQPPFQGVVGLFFKKTQPFESYPEDPGNFTFQPSLLVRNVRNFGVILISSFCCIT